MNDRGDVVFHLPGEGMAEEALGATRVPSSQHLPLLQTTF